MMEAAASGQTTQVTELLSKGISDVELLLSEGEEVGFIGMDGYLKKYSDKSDKTFFVNLDVTNEGFKKYGSIEYDRPNFSMLKQVQGLLKDQKMFFTGDWKTRSGVCCGLLTISLRISTSDCFLRSFEEEF